MSKTIAAVCVGLMLAGAVGPTLARPRAESSFAPARMIEVRPGLWVGSYQCITDLDRGGRDCSSGI
jgi:hypothetical protein